MHAECHIILKREALFFTGKNALELKGIDIPKRNGLLILQVAGPTTDCFSISVTVGHREIDNTTS
jgi:hypothetical protein